MSGSFATPWTIARQAPLFMRFPRQEYWSGLPFRSPGDLPNPGIEPVSPALLVDSLPLSLQGSPDMYVCMYVCTYIHIYTHTIEYSLPLKKNEILLPAKT